MTDARERNRPTRREPQQDDLLFSGLVHELRQPLTGLGAGLRLLARDLGASVTDLDGWRLAIGQLDRLQETLATYQRLMTPGELENVPFPVDAVVRGAVAGMRHRLDTVRGAFALHVAGDVPRGHGAPQALHHALTNLLANAVDAVKDAGGNGRIEVRVVRGEGARPQVRVADQGIGIAPAVRARLFAPRFTTKARGRGTGLGLAISRRMLRASGGELRVADDHDAARPAWARTELVVDLAAGPDAPAPRAPDPAPAQRWGGVASGAAALGVLAAVLAASWTGFERWVRAGDRAPLDRPAPAVERVAVSAVAGALERLRGTAWQPIAAGALLSQDDTLRTGEGSRATIALGDRSSVTVSDATQLTVREITAAAHRLRLARGRISVDHQPDGARVLLVESERGDAVARAGPARFSVLATGASLAVATEAGNVRLHAGGRGVDVGPGEGAVSFGGEPPAPATPIPVALLLEIGRAAGAAEGGCRIEGIVPAGSEVRVDGQAVTPGRDGRFSVAIARRDRARHATVVTRDVSGRLVERRVPCMRRAPEAAPERVSDFAVRWGHE